VNSEYPIRIFIVTVHCSFVLKVTTPQKYIFINFHLFSSTVTSTKVRPVSPDVAKHFIEAYYSKLESRLAGVDTLKRSKKKIPKRTVSFNQNDPRRGSRMRLHPRRMSVDVDLLLSQGNSKLPLARTFSGGGPHPDLDHTHSTIRN